jgi:hypothetical protein
VGDKKNKRMKLMKFIFMTYLNAFASNVFLAPKVMNFEDVDLIKVILFIHFKVIHFYVVKIMNA